MHIRLIWCAVLAFALIGCGRRQSSGLDPWDKIPHARASAAQFAAANDARAKIGLAIINSNWFLYRSSSRQEDWNNPTTGATKRVFLDSTGGIVSEENYYYSGAVYRDFKGTGSESITVRYDFRNAIIGVYYAGTNQAFRTMLAPVLMPDHFTTNTAQALGLVNTVTKGWKSGSP